MPTNSTHVIRRGLGVGAILATLILGAGVHAQAAFPDFRLLVETDVEARDAFRLKIEAPESTWSTIFARLYMNPENAEVDPELYDTYCIQFPWLVAPPSSWNSNPNSLVLGGIPPTSVDQDVVLIQDPEIIAELYSTVVVALQPDLIRGYAQPATDLDPPTWHGHIRTWDVGCEAWNTNTFNPAPNMRYVWRGRLADPSTLSNGVPSNTIWFDPEKVVRSLAYAQEHIPGSAEDFLTQDVYSKIGSTFGLLIGLQAVGFQDPAIAFSDGGDNLTSALSSLNPLTGPPLGPRIRIAGATIVQVAVRDPVSGGGTGVIFNNQPFGPVAQAGGFMDIPLSGQFPPISVLIRVGNRETSLVAHPSEPGLVRATVPTGVLSGQVIQFVSIGNYFGTTSCAGQPWEFVNVQ